MAEDKDFIWARDPDGRAMLEEIAEFDSRKTGKVNLTTSLHRVLVEAYDQMKAQPDYKRWKRERDQAIKT